MSHDLIGNMQVSHIYIPNKKTQTYLKHETFNDLFFFVLSVVTTGRKYSLLHYLPDDCSASSITPLILLQIINYIFLRQLVSNSVLAICCYVIRIWNEGVFRKHSWICILQLFLEFTSNIFIRYVYCEL